MATNGNGNGVTNPLEPLLQPFVQFENTLNPFFQPFLTPLNLSAQGPLTALDTLLKGQTPEFLRPFTGNGSFPFPYPFPSNGTNGTNGTAAAMAARARAQAAAAARAAAATRPGTRVASPGQANGLGGRLSTRTGIR